VGLLGRPGGVGEDQDAGRRPRDVEQIQRHGLVDVAEQAGAGAEDQRVHEERVRVHQVRGHQVLDEGATAEHDDAALKELEASGIVRRVMAGPPVSGPVYELTEEGAALEPVLIALGRWGRNRPLTATKPMSVDALLLALRTTFNPAAAGDLAIEVDLRIEDDRVALTVADGQIRMRRGATQHPAATITADVAGLRELVYRGTEGPGVRIEGDTAAVRRLLAALR